jgi:hypothetical protein
VRMAVDDLIGSNSLVLDEVFTGVDCGVRSHNASLPRITNLVRLSEKCNSDLCPKPMW